MQLVATNVATSTVAAEPFVHVYYSCMHVCIIMSRLDLKCATNSRMQTYSVSHSPPASASPDLSERSKDIARRYSAALAMMPVRHVLGCRRLPNIAKSVASSGFKPCTDNGRCRGGGHTVTGFVLPRGVSGLCGGDTISITVARGRSSCSNNEPHLPVRQRMNVSQ